MAWDVFRGFACGILLACVAVAGWRLSAQPANESSRGETGGSPAPDDPLKRQIAGPRASPAENAAPAPPTPDPHAAAATAHPTVGARLLADARRPGGGISPDTWIEWNARLGEIALRLGIRLDEAIHSPEAMAELWLRLLEASDPPPDAAQFARLRAAVEAHRARWEAYLQSRNGMARLEQGLELELLEEKFRGEFGSLLPTEKWSMVLQVSQPFSDHAPRTVTWGAGVDAPPAEQPGRLAAAWIGDLGLDPESARVLVPIAGDYIRAIEMEDPGEMNPVRHRLRAMRELLRRIREVVDLTPEQARALNDWRYVHEVGDQESFLEEER